MDKTFAEHLVDALDDRNMRVAHLAKKSGVLQSVIFNWINYDVPPTRESMLKVAKVLPEMAQYVPPAPPSGEELKRLREAKGLSINAMAKLCGVTHDTICRWERGGKVRIGKLRRMLECYGVEAKK